MKYSKLMMLGICSTILVLGQTTLKGQNLNAQAKEIMYQYPNNPYIVNVTAIANSFGDGQKIAAIAIEYKDPIDEKSVDVSDFSVPGTDINSAYVNNQAAITKTPKAGNFVIVELKTFIDNEKYTRMWQAETPQAKERREKEHTGPTLGERSNKPATPVILTASISDIGIISTSKGKQIVPSKVEMKSNKTIAPDIEGFKQLVFHDKKFNQDLMYNLYLPKDYDATKKYPLVLFMHDAGVVSNNPIETLTQGEGATIFASDRDQTAHPAFVLAPQYKAVMADDNSKTTDDMDITINLVNSLMQEYSIDKNRIYNTGQSMGGMVSIAMDIKYPDFFAASLLVACQWDANLVKPLAKKPLWIVISEGDAKANPGMNAITSVLQSEGATIAKANWSAEADKNTQQKEVEQMLSKRASVNFTIFNGGDHGYTWRYAYSIDGIRDWLFQQHK